MRSHLSRAEALQLLAESPWRLEDVGRAVLRSDVPPELVREVVAEVLS